MVARESYFTDWHHAFKAAERYGFKPVTVIEFDKDTDEAIREYDTFMTPCTIHGYEDCMVLLAPVVHDLIEDCCYVVDDDGFHKQTFKLVHANIDREGNLHSIEGADGYIELQGLCMYDDGLSDEPCVDYDGASIMMHDPRTGSVKDCPNEDELVHGLAMMMRAVCTEDEFDGLHHVYVS